MVGLAEDDLEAAFQVFFVRGGRVLGRKGWVVDRVEDLNRAELVASFVRQLYMERTRSRRGCSCRPLPADREVLRGVALRAAGNQGRRSASRSEAPSASCCEVVDRNAAEAFHRHKLRRASDFGARSRALSELAEQLGPAAGAAPDRVLRHLEPGADRHGRLDGGVRGRAAEAERLPAVRDQGRARTGRFRKHGGDAPAQVHPAAEGAGRAGTTSTAAVRVPAVARRRRRRARAARRLHPGC